MQNTDRGWTALDARNDALFINSVPFADIDSMCDPSTPDIVGRVLEAFGLMMEVYAQSNDNDPSLKVLMDRIKRAAHSSFPYLEKTQKANGSWFGNWGINYIYGTSNVLCGLEYFQNERYVKRLVLPAVHWLKSIQNSDVGGGEAADTYYDASKAGMGPSSAAQTAWAIMALLAHCPPTDDAIQT